MPELTDLDIRILTLAERLEGVTDSTGRKSGVIHSELGMSPARYTQRLMHLVQVPEVVADPRWTMLAHRIRRVMASAAQARASRTFTRSA